MEKYSELLQTLLKNRGIKNIEEAEKFLNPNYEKDLFDPFLMKDMERACVRIFEAIDNKEKIMIYADYDVDGIPGAVVLQDLLKKINYQSFEVYIPGRNDEGYGLNLQAIEEFAKKNIKLLITIDLGITAVKEIAQAEVLGIDVIVTDHHIPLDVLPRAYAILNPKVCNYPEQMLCGAGVVFKLVQAFIKKYGEFYKIKTGAEKWMLDMVGLATLSDMVPLLGENRVLAYYGMKVLKKSPRPGFQKLLKKINVDQKNLTEDDLAFMVTPKLNAASRMDDPRKAYEILATDDEQEAGMLADYLSKINDERKLIVASIVKEAKKNLEKRTEQHAGQKIIVIGNPKWRVGVLGIVAGKIAEECGKTVFVWGKDENDMIKGSCRSGNNLSVVDLMNRNKEFFSEFGGHSFAGGFTVLHEKIHFLEDALIGSLEVLLNENDVDKLEDSEKENSKFDLKTDLSIVNMKNWREIEKLAPFGFGNIKPIFLFENVKVEKIKKFGKNGSGEHLEISFSDANKNNTKAISFFSNQDSFSVLLEEGRRVNLLANFDFSRFRGKDELRLRIIDIM